MANTVRSLGARGVNVESLSIDLCACVCVFIKKIKFEIEKLSLPLISSLLRRIKEKEQGIELFIIISVVF